MRGEEEEGGRGRGKEEAAVAGGGGGGEGGDGGGQPGYTCRRPHLTFRLTFFRSGVFTRSGPAPPSLLSLSAPCLPCHLHRANGTVQGPLSTPGIWWTGIQPSLFSGRRGRSGSPAAWLLMPRAVHYFRSSRGVAGGGYQYTPGPYRTPPCLTVAFLFASVAG